MNRTWIPIVALAGALAGCAGQDRSVAPQMATLYPNIPAAPDAPGTVAHAGLPADRFGEGTHRVIDEIKPGTYRTGGSVITDYPVCSWQLIDGDHLIASGSATGAVSIVVEPVYSTVQSSGCLDWVRQP